MNWWEILLSILGGLLLLWLVLVVLLWWAARRQPEKTKLGDALRLVPDVIRLLLRLAADRTVPRAVRVWLVVLRVVTRHAGAAALDKHWPGTAQGLQALRSLAGIRKDVA